MAFFIKRNEQVNGPFTEAQIKSGAANGKLKPADMIATSKEGPWTSLASSLGNNTTQVPPQTDTPPPPPEAAPVHSSESPGVADQAPITLDTFEVADAAAADSSEVTQRIQLLIDGRVRYDEQLAARSQAEQAKQTLLKSQTDLHQPLGAAVFSGHCEGQLPETATLHPLLGAHAQLRELETEYNNQQATETSGIGQKAKQKAQLLAINVKIKNLTRSLKKLEVSAGRQLMDDDALESVRCAATNAILGQIGDWKSEVTQAETQLQMCEADLEKCRVALEEELGLKPIEGIATFDKAIRECEMKLTSGDGRLPSKTSASSIIHRLRSQQTTCRHCHRQKSLWSPKCANCGQFGFSRKKSAIAAVGAIIICLFLAAIFNGTSEERERENARQFSIAVLRWNKAVLKEATGKIGAQEFLVEYGKANKALDERVGNFIQRGILWDLQLGYPTNAIDWLPLFVWNETSNKELANEEFQKVQDFENSLDSKADYIVKIAADEAIRNTMRDFK